MQGSPPCGPGWSLRPLWGVLGLGLALPSLRSCGRCSWFSATYSGREQDSELGPGPAQAARHIGAWASGNADGRPGEGGRALRFLPWGLRWQPSGKAASTDPAEPVGGAWPLGQVPGVLIAPRHVSLSTRGTEVEDPCYHPPSLSGSCPPRPGFVPGTEQLSSPCRGRSQRRAEPRSVAPPRSPAPRSRCVPPCATAPH